MKCRVCKGPAVIDLPRHNANFCPEHLTRFCQDQTAKAIRDHDMLHDGDRVLVAVSGGKDSLALWEILVALGYAGRRPVHRARDRDLQRRFGSPGAHLRLVPGAPPTHEVDLEAEHGYNIPDGSRDARRTPCSACGLSKRHIFDRVALEHGYDVLATGHNLDDEAAVLFGNVLRWQTDYLGRQHPVLPAGNGFPKKVKPLIRLTEREMAAYAIVNGIEYIVDECPMAAGNRHLGYKEALNAIERTSPGTTFDFYHRFLASAADRFAPEEGSADDVAAPPVRALWRANARRRVRILPPRRKSGRFPYRGVHHHETHRSCLMSRPLEAAERVLLVDRKDRRYLVTLEPGAEFHSHAGSVAHDDLIGSEEGVLVHSSQGASYLVLRPTISDVVLKMPRGAQVIYPKDLGPLLLLADIFPGARVLESGVGSGALSMTLLRAGANVTGYELREDFAARATKNVEQFLGREVLDRYRVELRDCYDGIDESGVDRILLDLPEPWRVVPHAESALRSGGILVAYTPSITQASRLREQLASGPFAMAETIEVLHRGWHIEGQAVRPDHRMVAHTGFLTSARLVEPAATP